MRKAIILSIRPQWCELIASGQKTVEIRKTKPKIDVPFKCYIYCTQGLFKDLGVVGNEMYQKRMKVIGEFVCDRIEAIGFSPYNHGEYICKEQSFIEDSCVPFDGMFDYLGEEYGYGWHISNLVIYDQPREINEFVSASILNTNCFGQHLKQLDRPPQSWCYAILKH